MLRTIFLNLLALIAGSFLPLAFAPFGYYPIGVIAPAILLWLWTKASSRQALLYGLLFGIGFFGFGVSWVYISIHTYGNATILTGILITGAMVLFLALFPAFQGYLLNRLFPANNLRKLLLAFPASWVLFEWMRTWILSGFPWLLLGCSQIDSPLRGYVPIVGEAGLAYFVTLSAGMLVSLFLIRKNWYRLIVIVAAIALWSGGWLLNFVHWVKPNGLSLKVSLVQGNIPQQQKWDPKQLDQILATYTRLTNKNLDSDLVVWPEGAIPAYPQEIKTYLRVLQAAAKFEHKTIFSGIPIYDPATKRSYNGAMALGLARGIYLKQHLVPFGEYLPFKAILSWLPNYFTIPMSGYSSGPKHQKPIIVNGVVIAPFICYEIAYAGLVLSHFPRANLLITLCDDSWFGKSIAAAQHVAIARMRSMETGRYQLLSTNTGISAIIDARGKIIATAPEFQEYVLTATVKGMHGLTPWVSYMHYFVLWLMLILLGVARGTRKK